MSEARLHTFRETLAPGLVTEVEGRLLANRLAGLGGGLRLIDASRYHALLAGALLPASTAP